MDKVQLAINAVMLDELDETPVTPRRGAMVEPRPAAPVAPIEDVAPSLPSWVIPAILGAAIGGASASAFWLAVVVLVTM